MDIKRKLELLARYNFSGYASEYKKNGFGNLVAGIFSETDLAVSRKKTSLKNHSFDRQNEFYWKLVEYYNKVDFEELDKEDEDFRFLFDYSDKLIKLGQELNNFQIEYFSRKDPSGEKIYDLILNIFQSIVPYLYQIY